MHLLRQKGQCWPRQESKALLQGVQGKFGGDGEDIPYLDWGNGYMNTDICENSLYFKVYCKQITAEKYTVLFCV